MNLDKSRLNEFKGVEHLRKRQKSTYDITRIKYDRYPLKKKSTLIKNIDGHIAKYGLESIKSYFSIQGKLEEASNKTEKWRFNILKEWNKFLDENNLEYIKNTESYKFVSKSLQASYDNKYQNLLEASNKIHDDYMDLREQFTFYQGNIKQSPDDRAIENNMNRIIEELNKKASDLDNTTKQFQEMKKYIEEKPLKLIKEYLRDFNRIEEHNISNVHIMKFNPIHEYKSLKRNISMIERNFVGKSNTAVRQLSISFIQRKIDFLKNNFDVGLRENPR